MTTMNPFLAFANALGPQTWGEGGGTSNYSTVAKGLNTGANSMDPITTSIIASSAGSAISNLAGGLLGGGSSGYKTVSTFSKNQKNTDRLLYDWLMGVTRNAKGQVISQKPILTDLMNKKYPQMQVAPFTDTQKELLGLARGMIPNATNLQRPDAFRQKQLAQGITPYDSNWKNTSGYMKNGGILPAGKSATVGEDGTEKIIALPGGGVKVIPNPKSLEPGRMGTVLKKMANTTKKTGLPAMAIDVPDYMRQLGSYYVPNTYTWTGDWDSDKSWSSTAKEAYNTYLSEQAKDADWLKNNSWYNTYTSKYGSDISGIPYETGSGGKVLNSVQRNYASNLSDWWNSLNQVQGVSSLTDATSAFSGLSTDLAEGFGNYLTYGGSTYAPSNYSTGNTWGQYTDPTTGEIVWGFSDPYSVDTNVLSKGIEAYLTEKGYQYNDTTGQWEVSPTDTTSDRLANTDWSPLINLIGTDESSVSGFNDFLETYKNGALSGQGVTYNRSTNSYTMNASGDYYAAMADAVQAYNADQAAKQSALDQLNSTTGTTTETTDGTTVIDGVTFNLSDLVQDEQGNYVPDPDKYEQVDGTWQKKATTEDVEDIPSQLAPILMGLASETFDPSTYVDEFNQGVREPAMRSFESSTRPAIRESFAGGSLFGSGREKAETQAVMDLNSDLNEQQATYVAEARQNFITNRSTAISQAMELATLPSEIQNAHLGAEATQAAIANIFNNMDLANAAADADFTTSEISNLAMLWSIFGNEQSLQNSEFQTAFANALNGEDGIQWSDVISLLYQYQDQTQTALVTG